jgi:CRP-like cAMP-binding protein
MREYAIGTDQDLRSALSAENMRKLAARGVERKFDRGECLFHQGDRGEGVLLLLDGRVKVCLIGASGQKTILRIHLPGSLIGMSALAALQVRDATATALETVTTVELTLADMQAVLLEDSALGLRVMRMLLDRLADLHSRLADLQAASVDQRLARVLLALGRRDPIAEATPTISLTHEDLSNMVGARRPTVTSALNRFVHDGLIEKCGRNIVVRDPERLTRLLAI